MCRLEERKHKRLAAKFDLSCCKVGSTTGKSHTGHTVNVSPGGLYFEIDTDTLKPDNMVKINLSIPPTAGQLELGGKISAFGRVLRAHNLRDFHTDINLSSPRYGVALEFCQSFKLDT